MLGLRRWLPAFVVMAMAVANSLGCGGDPELHPVTGKVTLGGKSYNRLLVYMRPVEGKVNQFNLGVGETDVTGKLALRSTAGSGLAAGKYRVSFSCVQAAGSTSNEALDPNEKTDDDKNARPVEMVPAPYDDFENANTSPVIFEIKPGENVYEFDIPAK